MEDLIFIFVLLSQGFFVSNIFLQELSLNGMGLSSVPDSVWGAEEILKLDLSRNIIEDLPKEFSSCSSLQVTH